MADEIDKMLDSYKVADADDVLLDRIVTIAQKQAANENAAKRTWLQRGALLAATAVLGFWLGNATVPAAKNYSAPVTQTTGSEQYYLDRMIMGPKSLDDMQL
jgi:hypothetical protein